jgi:hypothetical protein
MSKAFEEWLKTLPDHRKNEDAYEWDKMNDAFTAGRNQGLQEAADKTETYPAATHDGLIDLAVVSDVIRNLMEGDK